MKPSLVLLHAVERALAARGRQRFLEKAGRWEGAHQHSRWLLADLEFRSVPMRGQVLGSVPEGIVHFRLEKHVDGADVEWTLDTTVPAPEGPCRCRVREEPGA